MKNKQPLYYNSIDNLPHWNFIQIRKTNDLRYLFELDSYLNLNIVEPKPEHLKAFEEILLQYNEKILERSSAKSEFDIDKEISILESEKYICELYFSQIVILEGKKEFKDDYYNCINELSKYGHEGNKDQIRASIDSYLNQIDDFKIMKKSSSKNGDAVTIEQMINLIEKYRNMPLNTKVISVAQYIEYENDFLKYVADASNKRKSDNR